MDAPQSSCLYNIVMMLVCFHTLMWAIRSLMEGTCQNLEMCPLTTYCRPVILLSMTP
ncbi:hypothetical protein DPMN_102425 [Dreissena polymorpha]|uniref:Uncharacterized protein n=1 Tax=Dreissena polymorpha TaxID=45954 RepID=A0A9D4LL30_DREPO|nr:hypothetical protein DPMN_192077 [Dreissena polymorpha]KAH3859608.1 hypothetical protein DPMN_102425 [Dreissena polymorpha]